MVGHIRALEAACIQDRAAALTLAQVGVCIPALEEVLILAQVVGYTPGQAAGHTQALEVDFIQDQEAASILVQGAAFTQDPAAVCTQAQTLIHI